MTSFREVKGQNINVKVKRIKHGNTLFLVRFPGVLWYAESNSACKIMLKCHFGLILGSWRSKHQCQGQTLNFMWFSKVYNLHKYTQYIVILATLKFRLWPSSPKMMSEIHSFSICYWHSIRGTIQTQWINYARYVAIFKGFDIEMHVLTFSFLYWYQK